MPKDNDLKRIYKFCIKLNKKELALLNKYCDKYNITNKSQFIRQTLMKNIIEKMVEQDYPSLFSSLEQKNTSVPADTTTSEDTDTTIGKDDDIQHPKLF